MREQQDAAVQGGAHEASDHRSGLVGPALDRQGHRVGPDPADAQPHEEPKHQHLALGFHKGPQAGEDRIKQNAHPECAGAANPVAQSTQHDATDRGTQHQCGGEASEPVAPEHRGVGGPEEGLGYGQRGHRHQTQFHAVEEQGEDRGGQDAPSGQR